MTIRGEARAIHNCMADPKKAPLIARQSLGRVGVAKPPRVKKSKAPASTSAVVKLPLRYPLLPTVTVRRLIRPEIRITKRPTSSHPYRLIREELYKPLPDGWAWPPIPFRADLPTLRPKRKEKRRIPQEVLDEWLQFQTRRSPPGPGNPPGSEGGSPGPAGNGPDDPSELLDPQEQGGSSDEEPSDGVFRREGAAMSLDDDGL